MELKDFLFTPLYLILIFGLSYFIRPRLTNIDTRNLFLPALALKIFGSLCVGFLYHYFYKYGDTLRYHFFSEPFYSTLWSNPYVALKLFISSYNTVDYDIQSILSGNYFFQRDVGGYFMLKVTGFLGLFTMHSYYAIACLYAFVSFFGLWKLFQTVNEIYPQLKRLFFVAIFCIPSVVFWGSGILKDTITLSCIGWLTYCIYEIFIKRKPSILKVIILATSIYVLIILKIYIILCFIPAITLWISGSYTHKIKSKILRITLGPAIFLFYCILAYQITNYISQIDSRYSLENIEKTMRVTADWITYTSGESGSVYSLGDDFDLSPTGIIRKLPAGVNVTLFRPYLWEIRNSVMLLAALESLLLSLLTLYTLYRVGVFNFFRIIFTNPFIRFLFIFSIVFSFAVGISTYNFGTLVRYKIPGIPFYIMMLFTVLHEHRRKLDSIINFDKMRS